MTDAEFEHMAKDMKTIVDPRVLLIAEKDGEPLAFSLALPDFNQALKKVNGRLFPLGLPKLIYYGRHIQQVRVLALGIAKKVQNWNGLGAALYYQTFRRGVAAGYRSCEFSWTLESNDLINRSMQLFTPRFTSATASTKKLLNRKSGSISESGTAFDPDISLYCPLPTAHCPLFFSSSDSAWTA